MLAFYLRVRVALAFPLVVLVLDRELERELGREPFPPFESRFEAASTFRSAASSSRRFSWRSFVIFVLPSVRAIVISPV